jgi:hypothetical protein
MAKTADTEWKKVKVSFRDPNEQTDVINVGGNNLIINGKKTLKQFKFRPDTEVELPVTFIEQLKRRYRVMKDKNDNIIELPIFFVEEV